MRYRADNPADLIRARELVKKWREEHPQGKPEEMVTAVGGKFPKGYEPVLRGVLFALELHGPQDITGGPGE